MSQPCLDDVYAQRMQNKNQEESKVNEIEIIKGLACPCCNHEM